MHGLDRVPAIGHRIRMKARIYQQPKSSMQSGRRNVGKWLLEYDPAEKKVLDPLTGWFGSGDVRGQIALSFDSRESAVAYAEANGLEFDIVPLGPATLKLQAYADNFR